jgi:hypothetical protein
VNLLGPVAASLYNQPLMTPRLRDTTTRHFHGMTTPGNQDTKTQGIATKTWTTKAESSIPVLQPNLNITFSYNLSFA